MQAKQIIRKTKIKLQTSNQEKNVNPCHASLTNQVKMESQILQDISSQSISDKQYCNVRTNTKGTSRRDKNKSAAQRYRQKRKILTKNLQQKVNFLQNQIFSCENELKTVKDKLQHTLKASKNTQEHSDTYTELSIYSTAQYPDLDRINLVLDTLKYRIGANGKERQAKIDYNFKQIVNTLFPALHRYFMYAAQNNLDFFSLNGSKIDWMQDLLNEIQLSPHQILEIRSLKENLINSRNLTKFDVSQLNRLKVQLKVQQEVVENIMNDLRKQMHPVQSADLILFCQRHKYRRCIGIQFDQPMQNEKPRKIRKN